MRSVPVAFMELSSDGTLVVDNGLATMSSVLRTLHKQRRQDRIAHLRSIDHDANFVAAAHLALGCPALLANLRCGVWYAPPDISSGHCYYKSTDGHSGCWDFSLSRLNLQVALAAAKASSDRAVACAGGVMIVDSTRSGKRFPDALSKTIPIWCCVVNRALAQERGMDGMDGPRGEWDTKLRLPPWVPPSEAAQIEAKLGGGVASLRRPALAPVLAKLMEAVRSPLRPGWLCPGGDGTSSDYNVGGSAGGDGNGDPTSCYVAAATKAREEAEASGVPFVWVHCICASEECNAERARERASYTYVQGAGDDEENWARGLTAELWWQWRDELMALAARDPEGAEALLAEKLEARRGSGRPAPAPAVAAAASRSLRAASDHLDTADTQAASAGPASFAVASDATAAEAALAPACALWGSGLLLAPRSAAESTLIGGYADAVLDVGSSVRERPSSSAQEDGTCSVAALQAGSEQSKTPAVYASDEVVCASAVATIAPPAWLHVPVEDEGPGKSKRAQPSKDYWQRVVLPRALAFLAAHLSRGHRVLICCERGDDRSATVAVAALLALYEPDASTLRMAGDGGRILPAVPRAPVGKEDVRARLALLQGAYPPARLSRQLTKELNNFFVAANGGWRMLQLP